MILETTNPADLRQIFNDRVEAVIWKRVVPDHLLRTIEKFDPAEFHMTEARLKHEAQDLKDSGFDKRQIRISGREETRLHTLAALWKDRKDVGVTLQSIFNAPFFTNPMQVQPPDRDDFDSVFHQDRAKNNITEAEKRDHDRLIALVTHKNRGTILLPSEDAGTAAPESPDGRALYYNPVRIDRQYQADAHDIVLTRTGESGTVHRAPHISAGDRWLTLFFSLKQYPEMKDNPGLPFV